jgi:putative selenate reductase
MSDRFRPLSMEQLASWAFGELDRKGTIFGVPAAAAFRPRTDHRFRRRELGVDLDTPWGVAAGPHTQMAQNIVAAWLAGARLIELKTVQTLDELDVHKPCIDIEDEGYNVEWSQELRVHQSFDEYLRAWVLVHALHRALGFPGERPGVVFNMSVGYNLAGIRRPNVQWYLDAMADASAWLPAYVEAVARHVPAVRDIEIPARISDSVTLSTMHGCPPDEIERISRYLIEGRGLHTAVKCNPTLLGAERVREIVNTELGYRDIPIPDEAFGHDLRWEDAVPMFGRLRAAAAGRGVAFGLKLSNTLEVRNWRGVFDRDPTMYLSGRALHAVTVNLASRISDAFGGSMPLSFAGGADAFNLPDLLAGGLRTVTVCSDLLKTGGYLRLLQYPDEVDAAFDAVGATTIDDYVRRRALADGLLPDATGVADAGTCGSFNLRAYAARVTTDPRYAKATYATGRSKTARPLGAFDCIAAPCLDECPVDQQVPRYLRAVREGDLAEAARVTRLDNPLPAILGRVCDHRCEHTCVRTHLDEPLAIRHVKRFIMDADAASAPIAPDAEAGGPVEAVPGVTRPWVAIIGAGPAGLAAAEWLARAGAAVTILEAQTYPGGMVGGAIPAYRLPQAQIAQDVGVLGRLGVEVRYGVHVGRDVTVARLREEGFGAVFVAVGAQLGRRLGLPGEDAAGVLDGVEFLRLVREGRAPAIGPRVGVVGAGDTAMDCARTARRTGAAHVQLVYRRTIDQMPADREEVAALGEEGIEVVELARPVGLSVDGGRLAGLVVRRTEYDGTRDATGRKVPRDVPDSDAELPLDTLILAISQSPVLDLFGDLAPALTEAGFVATDPDTLATSIPGVWAGGDVAAHGPASIVKAAADGKRAAVAIARHLGLSSGTELPAPAGYREAADLDVGALTVRRAHRAYRTRVRAAGLDRRDGFEETVMAYTAEEARREAARCLDCDTLCSLCVGVCPNLALLTYEPTPMRAEVPVLAPRNGALVPAGTRPFAVVQRFQVAVLADLCNECGTCVTACPTAGRPYVDKPRLYVDAADFAAEPDNAFRILSSAAIEGRFRGETYRLERRPGASTCVYWAPGVRTVLDATTYAVLEVEATGPVGGGELSLAPAAAMATLLAGMRGSAPYLPTADEHAGGAPRRDTRVVEPALPQP